MDIVIKFIPASETWALRSAVMWPLKPMDYVKLPADPQGIHFGLFKGQHLVTVASLFLLGDTAQFRKLATKTDEQGKGFGSMMVAQILKVAQEKGIKKIWCNARSDKMDFYSKFGLVKTPETFSKENITYVVMEKLLP